MAHILVIDDNDTVREGLTHAIKKLGHEVIACASGQAGIEAFKARRGIDFVITDLKMDGVGGVEVLKTIAALDAEVPILIITGYAEVPIAVRAMKAGAFDFIEKPFSDQTLLDRIRAASAIR